MPFLPVNKEDMKKRGWDEVDFVFVTGDAYVDHPSFGPAILSRLLESRGYRVAILAQPDWKSNYDFTRFGKPRLGFLVSGGNMDTMVNHYTVYWCTDYFFRSQNFHFLKMGEECRKNFPPEDLYKVSLFPSVANQNLYGEILQGAGL